MFQHVVLIDDSDSDLIYGEVVLQRSGCFKKVTTVGMAVDALRLLASDEGADVDLILLDINMPEMDGFGFLAAFEAMVTRPDRRADVVMLTSSPDPMDRQRAATFASVKGYVVKPIDVQSAQQLEALLPPATRPAP